MTGTSAPRTIEGLVHRYAELLDGGDLDGVADLFAHATWRSGGRVLRGRDEVRRAYDPVILYDGVPRTKHVISNLIVDGDTSRCYFTVIQDCRPILVGRYRDRFEQAGGEWRFAERVILADLVGDLSRHYA